jgi:hypothetical protein
MKTQVADWTVSNNVLLAVEYLCDFYNNVETKTTEENTATGLYIYQLAPMASTKKRGDIGIACMQQFVNR